MVHPQGKKKPVRKFNFDPSSISPKAHLIKDNIIEYINNERKSTCDNCLSNTNVNQRKLKQQITQLINNHEYPKTNEERDLRIKYIDKQIELKLESKRLVDEYICKFEKIFLKEKLEDYSKILKKTSVWEENELEKYNKVNKEYEDFISNLIAKNNINRENKHNNTNDQAINQEFENFKLQAISKCLETKPNHDATENDIKIEDVPA